MNTKYRLQDGGCIAASSASEFVSLLRVGSRGASTDDNASFMEGFAARYKSLYEKDVNTESEDAFLSDLIRLGYVRVT